MQKVLIALKSEFSLNLFKGNFFREGFQVAATSDGEEALSIINTETPDIVLADINLPGKSGLQIIEEIKKSERTKKIPVIIYSRTGSQEHREKAMDYEARDFVVGLSDRPHNVVLRAKAHLGVQKVYTFPLAPESETSRELVEDMGVGPGTSCPDCGGRMSINLTRDLSLGKNTFKLSFACTKCNFRSTPTSRDS